MAQCSESIGIIVAPYFLASDKSFFPATTRGSLLAINIFLPAFMDCKIDLIPTNPEKAAITISISLSDNNSSRLLEKFISRLLFTSFSENTPSDRNIFETLNSFACSKINFLFFLATRDSV